MRRVAAIALMLGVVVAACGNANTGHIDCGSYVERDGRQYEGFSDVRVTRGAAVGLGRNPCREDRTRYELAEVRGVSPELMLVETSGRLVFVRRGTLPILRDFPLSERFTFQRPVRLRCERPARFTVTLTDEIGQGNAANTRTRAGRSVGLTFVRSSRVRAARTSAGQPRLRNGDRVVVSGVACPKRKFVHLRVATLRPAG